MVTKGKPTPMISEEHMKIIRENAEKLNCLMCKFSSDDKGMILHTQQVHQQLLRYECVECGYRVFYRKSMNLHMKSKHRQECLNSAFLYLNCTLCIEELWLSLYWQMKSHWVWAIS